MYLLRTNKNTATVLYSNSNVNFKQYFSQQQIQQKSFIQSLFSAISEYLALSFAASSPSLDFGLSILIVINSCDSSSSSSLSSSYRSSEDAFRKLSSSISDNFGFL